MCSVVVLVVVVYVNKIDFLQRLLFKSPRVIKHRLSSSIAHRSIDRTMECRICYEEKVDFVTCSVCTHEHCVECNASLRGQRCPFCRSHLNMLSVADRSLLEQVTANMTSIASLLTDLKEQVDDDELDEAHLYIDYHRYMTDRDELQAVFDREMDSFYELSPDIERETIWALQEVTTKIHEDLQSMNEHLLDRFTDRHF